MAEFPGELRYAESHEWARVEEDGTIIVVSICFLVNT